ncbi:MAG: winged helix-turn-helix transcriptional regulator [Acidobacteriaceae bacterium]|nr:winged helix-turn-helix transcriptional regulator [Acidobacteriaceae bacterium]MBV9781594.1 winged helix-turn-helix transcriptional regulator [Acidobacteriaceae bacterium]
MSERLPLPALLSHALVAFTIEFDNEFEHQTPHRTTNHDQTPGSTSVPWLVSMAMWIKFMRFVPDDGTAIRDLLRRAALKSKEAKVWLTRMSKWWGYVAVDRSASDHPLDWIVRPTAGGKKALRVWRPLTGIIEERWGERFGNDTVAELRRSLQLLARQLNRNLPDYLPILGYEMMSEGPESDPPSPNATALPGEFTLPILMSKVLLAFALEFERESGQSLAIAANVLRLAGDEGTRVRDLPLLSGVSKEAIAMAVKRLQERGFAVVEPSQQNPRAKVLILTAKGKDARNTYRRLVWTVEQRWEAKFGSHVINLRQSLERLAGESGSLFYSGLEPYPDGWRASLRRPETLPHYPMVLHRGGFPDGS